MEELIRLTFLTGEIPHPSKRMLLEVLSTAWVAVKIAVLISACYLVVNSTKSYHETLPIPMRISTEKPRPVVARVDVEREGIINALRFLECPEDKYKQLSDGILRGAKAIGVDPKLVLAILFTESRFNPRAVSSKRYKGYMQTPWASMEYADVDI